MKTRATLVLALTAALAAAQAPAQEQEQPKLNEFALNAQMFTRGEWRDGGVAIEDNMDDMRAFILSRLRLTTTYHRIHRCQGGHSAHRCVGTIGQRQFQPL